MQLFCIVGHATMKVYCNLLQAVPFNNLNIVLGEHEYTFYIYKMVCLHTSFVLNVLLYLSENINIDHKVI